MKNTLFSLFLFLITQFYYTSCFSQSVNFEWVSATNEAYSNSIIKDSSGNIYVIGSFSDTVDFDPGPLTLNLISAGGPDIFVQKLDNNGNLIWAKSIGGISGDNGSSIGIDSLNNVYIVGAFSDSVDFNPNIGQFNLISTGTVDGFISKWDSNGNFIYAKQLECTSTVNIVSMDISQNGFVYLTGAYYGTTDFDPSISNLNFSSTGSNDLFLAKYDLNANLIWANTYGGVFADMGNRVAVDINENVIIVGNESQAFIKKIDSNGNLIWSNVLTGNITCSGVDVDTLGNIFVCGYFSGTVDVDPGSTIFNLSTFSTQNAFTLKLSNDGNFIWAKAIGGGGDDKYHSVTIDYQGNPILIGEFQATVDFNPGAATNVVASNSNSGDIFIHKYGTNGAFLWVKTMGSNFSDSGKDIVTDTMGNVYVVGLFQGTSDFNPSTAIYPLTTQNTASFVEKLGNCAPVYTTQTISACNSYQWINGVTYTTSNYTDSYNKLSSTPNGCDSIYLLNLTINQSETYIDTIFSCLSYTWINGITYTTSTNTPTWTLVNSLGCDSVVTLHLTIQNVNVTVSHLNDSTFSANATNANFQWIDCSNNSSLLGETSQNYIALSNGSYAVVVTQGGCVDTSSCQSVTVGMEEINLNPLKVNPNPTQGEITISLGAFYPNVDIQISDLVGNVIDTKTFFKIDEINLSLDGPAGFYLLDVIIPGKKETFKIYKCN